MSFRRVFSGETGTSFSFANRRIFSRKPWYALVIVSLNPTPTPGFDVNTLRVLPTLLCNVPSTEDRKGLLQQRIHTLIDILEDCV